METISQYNSHLNVYFCLGNYFARGKISLLGASAFSNSVLNLAPLLPPLSCSFLPLG